MYNTIIVSVDSQLVMSKIAVKFEMITPSFVRHTELVERPVQYQPQCSSKRKKNLLCKFKRMIALNVKMIKMWIIFCNFLNYMFMLAANGLRRS